MNVPCKHEVTPVELAAAVGSVEEMSRVVSRRCHALGSAVTLLAWVGDFHCFAPRDYGEEDLGSYGEYRDPCAIAQLALAEVKALRPVPNLFVYGGDLVNSGHRITAGNRTEGPADEYAALASVLSAHAPRDVPSVAILGNHDHGDFPLSVDFHRDFESWKRPDWPGSVASDDFYFCVALAGWRVIGLDTRHGVPLTTEQRGWLAAVLEDESLPTVVLQHRPFLRCWNDVDLFRLVDPETLDIIAGAPQVRAVVSGHTHKAAAWRYRGQAHVIFPALAYGIGDAQGWGCLLLHPEREPEVIVKELAIQFEDGGTGRGGGVRELDLKLYPEPDS